MRIDTKMYFIWRQILKLASLIKTWRILYNKVLDQDKLFEFIYSIKNHTLSAKVIKNQYAEMLSERKSILNIDSIKYLSLSLSLYF